MYNIYQRLSEVWMRWAGGGWGEGGREGGGIVVAM